MSTVADLIARMRDTLQDTDLSASRTQAHIGALGEAMQRLGRLDKFTQITWVQAVADQGITPLPSQVVTLTHVLYNERALRYVTEAQLDYRSAGWERKLDEPKYWTTDNQAPSTMRIVPAPRRTGTVIPAPGTPLFQDMRDNFVLFYTEDQRLNVTDADDAVPGLLDWEDWLVWEATREMALRESPLQNLPVGALMEQLSTLWMSRLTNG